VLEVGNQIAAAALGLVVKGASSLATRGAVNLEVGSAGNGVYASARPVSEVFPELNGINPHYVENAAAGINTNCISCAIAAQQRLLGQNIGATASQTKYGVYSDLFPVAPLGYQAPSTVSKISQEMLAAGDGAVGTVVIQQGQNAPLHVINVVNRNGQVYFVDTQIGKIVTLKDNLVVRLGRPL